MRYVVLLKGKAPNTPPPAGLMEGIGRLGQEATQSGALLDTGGFTPGSVSRLSLAGGRLSVSDGPFTEAKELISYAIYDVRTREEVVEWTQRFLTLHSELWPEWEGEAEVVKVMGPEDFGAQP